MRTRLTGFTLIELAVVMFVITLLLSSLMVPLQTQVEQRQIADTEKALNEIRDALLGFAVAYGRLPCTDTDADGAENSPCAGVPSPPEGLLPWKSLGVTGTDPWGNAWRYRPHRSFSQAFLLTTQTSTTDNMRVRNASGTELTSSQERAAALVFSLGSNRTADGENASFEASSANYQSDIRTTNFDDVLIWIGRPTLFNRMVTAGKLP